MHVRRLPPRIPHAALARNVFGFSARRQFGHTPQSRDEKEERHPRVSGDAADGGNIFGGDQRRPSATYAGVPVKSYVLSPVFEEHHSLWQWRTIVCRGQLYAAPFLLHCAPGVSLQRPFLHPALVESIAARGEKGRSKRTTLTTEASAALSAALRVPSPIGTLQAAVAAPSSCRPLAAWVNELFSFLERGVRQTEGASSSFGGTYTDVFKTVEGDAFIAHGGAAGNDDTVGSGDMCDEDTTLQTGTRLLHSAWSVPLKHRNVIGCGLAEVVVAIDRYGAMLARRDITYAKACWAVLVDSKADVQPYLRCSAVAIEKELIAATAAHEVMNAAVGDPSKRPLVRLVDYPSLAHW